MIASVMIDLEALTQYVKKAKTGDSAAFAALFEATKDYTYAIAYALLEDLCEAQDVVQETYLKVYLQLDTLRDDRSFLRWLHTITYNLTQDHIRSHTQERLALAEVAEQKRNTQLTLDEWMMDTWKQDIIRDMIKALPPEQQEVIRLYYFQNRSVGEIAVLQDCPINTVKSRLFYARNTLQKLIEAEEERTGRMHLSPVVTILAATLMLPDVGMTLPREDAMRILAAVFTAVGSADGIALVGIPGEEAADTSRAASGETNRLSLAVRLWMFFDKRWFLRLRG